MKRIRFTTKGLKNKDWARTHDWIKDMSKIKGCTAFFTVLKTQSDGERIAREYPNRSCHSLLNDAANTKSSYIISRVWMTEDRDYALIDWLVKESLWAKYIINKDAEDVDERCLIIRTDIPSNLMAQALILTRQIWEFPNLVEIWDELVSFGIAKDLAFALAHGVSKNANKKGYIKNSTANLHSAMSSNFMTEEFFMNYLNDRPKNPNNTYQNRPNYRGVFGLWSGAEAESHMSMPSRAKHIFHQLDLPLDATRVLDDWQGKRTIQSTSKKGFESAMVDFANMIEENFRD